MKQTLAKDIMSKNVLTANNKMTVEEAMRLLVNNNITGLPVINDKGKMIGVLSEYDLIQQLSEESLSDKGLKSSIKFSKTVEAILESAPLNHIVSLFIHTKFRRIPVLNKQGKLKGIITRRDLMRLFYYRSKLE